MLSSPDIWCHNTENFFWTFFSTFSQCPNATDFRNGVVRFLRLRNHIGKDHMGIRFKYGPSYTPPKSPLREPSKNYKIAISCYKVSKKTLTTTTSQHHSFHFPHSTLNSVWTEIKATKEAHQKKPKVADNIIKQFDCLVIPLFTELDTCLP